MGALGWGHWGWEGSWQQWQQPQEKETCREVARAGELALQRNGLFEFLRRPAIQTPVEQVGDRQKAFSSVLGRDSAQDPPLRSPMDESAANQVGLLGAQPVV